MDTGGVPARDDELRTGSERRGARVRRPRSGGAPGRARAAGARDGRVDVPGHQHRPQPLGVGQPVRPRVAGHPRPLGRLHPRSRSADTARAPRRPARLGGGDRARSGSPGARGPPLTRGFELLARVAAAAATADLVRRARGARARRALLAGIVAVGSAQALLAIVQSLTGKALAVRPFAFDGELYQFGSSWAGRGGFGHPYHLSCLLALAVGAAVLGVHGARRPLPWCLALGLCATGMAVTFSRARGAGSRRGARRRGGERAAEPRPVGVDRPRDRRGPRRRDDRLR